MAKQISKECHDQSIVDFIVAQASSAQQACFAGCPSYSKPATYKSDPCWARCFFALGLGPEAGQRDIHGTGGLPNAVLKQAWETAFETEDPRQGVPEPARPQLRRWRGVEGRRCERRCVRQQVDGECLRACEGGRGGELPGVRDAARGALGMRRPGRQLLQRGPLNYSMLVKVYNR